MSTVQPGAPLILEQGRVIDPARGLDQVGDVLVQDGRLVASDAAAVGRARQLAGVRVVDCRGRWVVPGLIDMHTHLREPGEEGKEDIASGCRAAVAGGFTAVVAMANTRPVNDSRAVTEYIRRRAEAVGLCRVYPVGAITRGLLGEELSEMGELQAAGCIAVSDDGKPVPTAGMFRRALEYASTFGLVLIEHAEDPSLSAGGCMNEGCVSTRLGLPGVPAVSEIAAVARDVAVAEAVGGRLHIAHVSTAGALRIIREARQRGVQVTCEVTPHHLWLTDEACGSYDTHFKMNPPLRTLADRDALRLGLADGTIDALATDHAPHTRLDKEMEFERAAFGVTGLETALPLLLDLCRDGLIGVSEAIARLTSGPARALGLLESGSGTLSPGAAADVTVIDPELEHVYLPAQGLSKSRNSAFAGRGMRGRAVLTLVGGRVVHEHVAGGRADS